MKSVLSGFLLLFLFLSNLTAQVTDDFSDGNFTSSPAWVGDVGNFQVNSSFQLQSNATVAGTSSLATANSAINNTEWNVWIRFAFSPSTSNFCRFYLVSNQSDLKTPLNGYYVQLGGSTGSTDTISLYKQTGSTRTRIIAGIPGTVAKTNNLVRLKVTRDNIGNWELLADTTGTGAFFTSQGTVFDNTHVTTSHVGWYCQYTITNATRFYLDDLYVGPIIVDTAPPELLSATVISPTEVDLLFNENLKSSTTNVPSNYSISGGIGTPASASLDLINPKLVHLTLSTALTANINYTVTCSNIQDLAGNIIGASNTATFMYVVPELYDVIITEIMADPDPPVGLPNAEYLEVFNRSTKTLNLAGWKLSDNTSTATLATYTLNPNQRLILCSTTNVTALSTYGTALGVTSFPSLNNSGETLTLRDNNGNIIHRLTYSDTWYKNDAKKNGGYSLEMIDTNFPCVGFANWTASNHVQGGTPGQINSVNASNPDNTAPTVTQVTPTSLNTLEVLFNEPLDSLSAITLSNYFVNLGIGNPISANVNSSFTLVTLVFSVNLDSMLTYQLTVNGTKDCSNNITNQNIIFQYPRAVQQYDVIITEIMADPDPPVGLPNAEYLEVFNRSTKTLNLAGWKLSDNTSTATLATYTLNPNQRLILCSTTNVTALSTYGTALGVTSFPSLNNSGETLTLRDNNGNIIHRLTYSDTWYKNDAKKNGGYSLEMIDTNFPCVGFANWTASNHVQGGTPGQINSVNASNPDNTAPTVTQVTPTSLNTLEVLFNEPLDSLSAITLSNYFVNLGIGNPNSISIDANFTVITLTFTATFDTTKTYQLTVNNVRDCSGNITNQNIVFEFPRTAELYDVIISEFMADPTPVVALPNAEYIEIKNRSGKTFNLAGWKLSNDNNTAVLPNYVLKPDSFLILTSTTNAPLFTSYGKVLGVSSFPSISNDGELLSLKNNKNALIHKVNFTLDWYKDDVKKNGGYSLEMVDENTPCRGGDNWRASNALSGGTPGKINSVVANSPDTQIPKITFFGVINPNTVQIQFNEPLDSVLSVNPAFYTFNNGIGNPLSVSLSSPDLQKITLILNTALDSMQTYQLVVNGARDCSGNIVRDTLIVLIPRVAMAGDIIINEILFNPYTNGSDYVELYNNSEKAIDLKNWRIAEVDMQRDSSFNAKTITTDSRVLLPQQYICISADIDFIKTRYKVKNPNALLKVSSFPTYDDSKGGCVVISSQGIWTDTLRYYKQWHVPTLVSQDGVALERLSFSERTNSDDNWHSAASTAGFGTPGYENSQRVLVNENEGISLSPKVFSPDNDGRDDLLAIHYNFSQPTSLRIYIFDSQGRLVRKLKENELVGTEPSFFTWDGTNEEGDKCRMGIYIVWVETSDGQNGKHKKYKLVCVLANRL
jgi:hypothetical protein